MPLLSKPSSAARLAIAYVTLGALVFLWSGIYWLFARQYPEAAGVTPARLYICYGVMLTGLTLFVIGLALGRIGRSARHAELPPEQVTPTVARTDEMAASTGVASPLNPVAPTAAGTPVVAPPTPVPPTPGTQPAVAPNGTVPVATLPVAPQPVRVPNPTGPIDRGPR